MLLQSATDILKNIKYKGVKYELLLQGFAHKTEI